MFTLISKYNEGDYEDFLKMSKRIGADRIHFKGIMDNIFNKNNWQPLSKRFKSIKKRTIKASCSYAKRFGGILSYDGELQLCCISPHHKKPLIKLNAFKKKNLLEEMNSQAFFDTQKKCGAYSFCKTCYCNNYTVYSKIVNKQVKSG